MATSQRSSPIDRRTVLKSGATLAALQFSSPYIIQARGETPIRIGMVDPLTGVYAAIAQNEVVGARFAVEEINKKGGILARPVELLIEDSANDVGTGVQKTRKLIERDQVSFIVGDVNKSIGQAGPEVYLERIGPRVLKSQCIPTDESLWRIDRGPEFWAARRELLAGSFNDFLQDSLPQRRLASP